MRKVISADNSWKFKVENFDNMKKEGISHTEIYKASKAGGEGGYAALRFDDNDWRIVNLPHDRQTETGFSEKEAAVNGGKITENVWYRKSFLMDEKYKNKHFMLVFGGISVFSDIYFNGSHVKSSRSAYGEIAVDITERMHFGSEINCISVRAVGKAKEGWWYEGNGIYRHVKLYIKDLLHIAHNGLYINPVMDRNGKWRVCVETEIENDEYEDEIFSVETLLYDGNGEKAGFKTQKGFCPGDTATVLKTEIKIENPELWDIDEPNLYKAVCRIKKGSEVIDEESTSFGFRTFRFDAENGFFLNGKHIKIKGMCNHQDHAGVGVAVPDAVQEYRIKKLKNMGVNTYRCAHNWPATELLDACDKLGMMLIDENRNFETGKDKLELLEDMIKRDRNHPSIFMWSLFNEETLQGTDEGRRIFMKLKSTVKKLDCSRPVSGAMHYGWFEEEGCAPQMDVIGINYNFDSVDAVHKKYPAIPIIGSEVSSALSIRGELLKKREENIIDDYDNCAVNWGLTMQKCWEFAKDLDYLSGIIVWTGFDYRGEPTPFEYPTISSLFGVMDTCGFEKTGYYVCKSCFTDEPMMHIFPHWNHKIGDKVKVITVTNCDEVELFLNGKSLGKRDSKPYRQCIWDVKYVPGELMAVGYINNEEAAADSVKTAGTPVRVVAEPHKITLDNSGNDTAVVNVHIEDANGNRIDIADNLIKFDADGGAVIGVGNGNPNSHEKDFASERHLFNGRCQAIVKANEKTEFFTLRVLSEGLKSDNIMFEIRDVPVVDRLEDADNTRISSWLRSVNAFDEKPDGNMKIEDTDMNNFVDQIIDGMITQSVEPGWTLYRACVSIAKAEGKRQRGKIVIENIRCDEYELWVNGTVIDGRVNLQKCTGNREISPMSIEAEFDIKDNKKAEITLLIRSMSNHAGIQGKDSEVSFKILDN